MGSHLSNLIKVRSKKKMAKLPSLLVTLLIVGAFFEGNALRCFEGGGPSYEKLPKLVDCKGIEDVCYSVYAKTDLYSERGFYAPAGVWAKSCFKKSHLPEVSEEFGNGASDRCIEIKFHFLKSGKVVGCICSTDGCNQQIELEDDQTLAEAAAAAEAKAKAEAEEAAAAAAAAEAAAEAKAKAEVEEAARLAPAALMDVTNK